MSNQKLFCGFIIEVPKDKAVSKKQSGPSTKNYEITNRVKIYDKQSGKYVCQTSKESRSSGDYSNRGKIGHKDEYEASSTMRVGDKGGYTEYCKQLKVKRVNYCSGSNSGGSKGHSNSGGSKGHSNSGGSKGHRNSGGSKGHSNSGGSKGHSNSGGSKGHKG